MQLIDVSYFIGEINIANTDQQPVSERLEYFIRQYEKRFLSALLGSVVAAQFKVELAKPAGQIPQIWIDLKNILVNEEDRTSPIANYVYKFYQFNSQTSSVGLGEAKPKAENATMESVVPKVIWAWNLMVDWLIDNREWFIDFYLTNDLTGYYYTNYCYDSYRDEFKPMNSFNL